MLQFNSISCSDHGRVHTHACATKTLFGIAQKVVLLSSWEGNCRSSICLVMCYRLFGVATLSVLNECTVCFQTGSVAPLHALSAYFTSSQL